MKKIELIAKIVIFLLLVPLVNFSFVQYSQEKYNEGINLSKHEYIAEYENHKNELLKFKKSTDYAESLITTFLGLLIIVGGYESIVFIVSFQLKKLINKNKPKRGSKSIL